jgi:hypothetical protein
VNDLGKQVVSFVFANSVFGFCLQCLDNKIHFFFQVYEFSCQNVACAVVVVVVAVATG